MNVAYCTQIFINVVENMVVVKRGSTSKFICLVLIVSIILCNICQGNIKSDERVR